MGNSIYCRLHRDTEEDEVFGHDNCVAEILSLASSMILPSDDIERIEEVNNWSPLRKNYVFKNFMRKRAPAGFWSNFLDDLQLQEKRGSYFGGNNYADAVFRGLG